MCEPTSLVMATARDKKCDAGSAAVRAQNCS
jgi:hypothetical protein